MSVTGCSEGILVGRAVGVLDEGLADGCEDGLENG